VKKQVLEQFLLRARTKTYAAGTEGVDPLLPGSVQYEYVEGDYLYRDLYYLGNGIFPGLETIFYKAKPVWCMSYFGDFSGMSEQQADAMLRQALMDTWATTRLYNRVEKDYGNFRYVCDGQGTIDELSGIEELWIGQDKVYFFNYSGGYIGNKLQQVSN
jgi:hypothetical protein